LGGLKPLQILCSLALLSIFLNGKLITTFGNFDAVRAQNGLERGKAPFINVSYI
jgi:hypothetical protein